MSHQDGPRQRSTRAPRIPTDVRHGTESIDAIRPATDQHETKLHKKRHARVFIRQKMTLLESRPKYRFEATAYARARVCPAWLSAFNGARPSKRPTAPPTQKRGAENPATRFTSNQSDSAKSTQPYPRVEHIAGNRQITVGRALQRQAIKWPRRSRLRQRIEQRAAVGIGVAGKKIPVRRKGGPKRQG